jgi:citrate lyase alpha subunit
MTTNSESNDLAQIESLRNRVASLTAVIYSAINEDTSSLASRYMEEKMKNMDIADRFAEGKLEATEQIVSLIYENHYLHNVKYFGKDSEQALAFKNLIHSIRDIQHTDLGNV